MIEGLKLTLTGDELRNRLDERVEYHRDLVEHYKAEATREPDPKSEFDYVLPEQICKYEQERHQWRAETLEYIRQHVEGGEIYRLGPADLEFGEILPQQPGAVAQGEYERENRIGFSLERIAKEIGRSFGGGYAMAEAIARQTDRKPGERTGRKKKKKKTDAAVA